MIQTYVGMAILTLQQIISLPMNDTDLCWNGNCNIIANNFPLNEWYRPMLEWEF